MLKVINHRKIIMTRGDDIFLDFKVRSAIFPYGYYTLQDGDVCVLSIKKYKDDDKENRILVQVLLENDQFHIPAKATKDLQVGTYWYDVQLTLADGTINTVVPASPLILATEVS